MNYVNEQVENSLNAKLLMEVTGSLSNCHELLAGEEDIMNYCEKEISNQLSSDGYTNFRVLSKKMDEITETLDVSEDDPFFSEADVQPSTKRIPKVLMELVMSIKKTGKERLSKDEIKEYALCKLKGYDVNIIEAELIN